MFGLQAVDHRLHQPGAEKAGIGHQQHAPRNRTELLAQLAAELAAGARCANDVGDGAEAESGWLGHDVFLVVCRYGLVLLKRNA